MAKIDHKLEKWIRWLRIIAGELESLVIAKKVFWTVQGLIKAHPEIPYRQSIFYWYLGNTYIAYALTGIRRQAKFQKDSISLIKLLAEIVQEPTKVSRKYYLDLHAKTKKANLVDRQFDGLCQKSGDSYISSALVQRDLNKLKNSVRDCEDFADKLIAHRDQRPPKRLPRFKEVDKAIQTLDDLCRKYLFILLADSKNTVKEKLDYDWQEIFDYPWRQKQ